MHFDLDERALSKLKKGGESGLESIPNNIHPLVSTVIYLSGDDDGNLSNGICDLAPISTSHFTQSHLFVYAFYITHYMTSYIINT